MPSSAEDYDREDLLAELRRLRENRGTLPSMDDVAEESSYPLTAYVEAFGSYPEAVRAAGMETEIFTRGSAASNQQLIEDLREFADELGHRPSQNEMNEEGPYTAERYRRRFGSWNEAIETAGMTPWEPSAIPEDELLDALESLADAVDREVPSAKDMDESGPYSAATYRARFGGWDDALRAAGYEPENRRRIYSEEDVVEAIRSLAEELGRPPTSREMDERGAVSSVLAWQRFGSWDDALRASGYDPGNRRLHYEESDVAEAIRAVTDALGRIPTTDEFDDHEAAPMKSVTARARFGSWREALLAAGVTDSE